jgi:hypothetical protein
MRRFEFNPLKIFGLNYGKPGLACKIHWVMKRLDESSLGAGWNQTVSSLLGCKNLDQLCPEGWMSGRSKPLNALGHWD